MDRQALLDWRPNYALSSVDWVSPKQQLSQDVASQYQATQAFRPFLFATDSDSVMETVQQNPAHMVTPPVGLSYNRKTSAASAAAMPVPKTGDVPMENQTYSEMEGFQSADTPQMPETVVVPEYAPAQMETPRMNETRTSEMSYASNGNQTVYDDANYAFSDYTGSVKTLVELVDNLPEGVTKESGAVVIRLTIESMGNSMENILSEAQSVQSQLLEAVRSNIKKIEEYKTIIRKLESEIRHNQGKANQLSEIIDLFILSNTSTNMPKIDTTKLEAQFQ